MKVAVPFTVGGLRDAARDAVLRLKEAHPVVFHDVTGSDTAYAELLVRLWQEGEAFAIVEHDVVVRPDVLQAFDACPEPYCAFPYELGLYVAPALGCTRFRAELLERIPDAAERAARTPSVWGAPGHWRQLDVALLGWVLRDEEGLQPHVHVPPVEHLHAEKRLHPMFETDPVVAEYIAGTPAAWERAARLAASG